MTPLFELRWFTRNPEVPDQLQFRQKGELGTWTEWEDVPTFRREHAGGGIFRDVKIY